MYRPGKFYRRGRGRGRARGYYRGFAYERLQSYKCKDCKIACTSLKQLEEHLNGVKHKSHSQHESMEDDPFSLEHMVVLDETGEDLPNVSTASPASCDSSDEGSATTSDHFPSSHLVVLDETHDDNDNPASPASCDSSASESATLSSATTKTSDVTTKKKIKTEKLEDDQTSVSRLSVISSCHSSNSAPEAEAVPDRSKKFSSKKRYAETKNKESIKIFHVEPIKDNKDVFKFLKTFAVANESDVVFAKKVKEMFSDALMKYKQIKLEELYCTEAEHSPTEEPTGSTDDPCGHEPTNFSTPQATIKSSPPNSSQTPHTSNRTSSMDRQQGSPGINQSDSPHTSPFASRSLTYICDDTSNNRSAKKSANLVQSSVTEEDSLMESEECITAEAACSDDDDDNDV